MASLNGISFERRVTVLSVVLIVAFVMVIVRLGQIQFADGDLHRQRVENRRRQSIALPARPGRLLDRHGFPLVESVEAYELYVYPVRFRESNRIDALHDLAVALFPRRVDWLDMTPPSNRAESRAARLRRFLGAWENREEIAQSLVKAPVEALDVDVAQLKERWAPFLFPRGELIVPPNARLRSRLLDCLVIIAGDPALARRSSVRERLAEGGTLGDALDLDARGLVRAVEAQYAELDWLAGETDHLDLDAFLYLMFEREENDRRNLVETIDDIVNDRIALERLGTHDLSRLPAEERARLAEDLDLPLDDAETLWAALQQQRHAVTEGGLEPDRTLRGLLEIFSDVKSLRDLERHEPFERRALAHRLGLWTRDDREIKRALGARVREEAGYREEDYLSRHRRLNRIQHFKGGRSWRLGAGWSFETADRVWRLRGLGAAGFDVRASWRRQYWGDADGFASFLVGRELVGVGTVGGLERTLPERDQAERAAARRLRREAGLEPERAEDEAPGFLGRDGRLVRRRGLDGRFAVNESSHPPRHGHDVRLTIDRELQVEAEGIVQRVAEESNSSLGAGLCVLDIQTGEILTLASGPNVDSERMRTLVKRRAGIDLERRALNRVRADGTLDRADYLTFLGELQERLENTRIWDPSFQSDDILSPPGSVVKVFSALVLLETLTPTGEFDPDEVMNTPDKGPVDLHGALYLSSNDYFREHIKKVDHSLLIDWFEGLGLFKPTPLLVSAGSGRNRVRQVRRARQSKNDVIGQGSVSTSPLEVASMMASLARRGVYREPRILVDEEGAPPRRDVTISEASWQRLARAMGDVARHYDPQGAEEVDLGGKTGTADGFKGTRWAEHNQAWFAGVFPVSKPRYAFAMTSVRTRWRGKNLVPFCSQLARLVLDAESRR